MKTKLVESETKVQELSEQVGKMNEERAAEEIARKREESEKDSRRRLEDEEREKRRKGEEEEKERRITVCQILPALLASIV